MKQARQGDVFVEKVRSVKGQPVKTDRVILAYGEVTGHCHEVVAVDPCTDTETMPSAQLFEEPDGARYLLVERACQIVHQEHGTIPLAPGAYRVTRQREYTPSEIRQVVD